MNEPFTFNIDYDRLAEAIARRIAVKEAAPYSRPSIEAETQIPTVPPRALTFNSC